MLVAIEVETPWGNKKCVATRAQMEIMGEGKVYLERLDDITRKRDQKFWGDFLLRTVGIVTAGNITGIAIGSFFLWTTGWMG
jgi:hypothetical protein